MTNIISEKDELKVELADKICSCGIDRHQAGEESNYIASCYENDKDYKLKMELAKLSYDLNQELTKTERIYVIDGMMYAKNGLDSLQNNHISNSLSFLMSRLDKDQKDGEIILNEYEDAYFRYGLVSFFAINDAKDNKKVSIRQKFKNIFKK